jgi:demethylmenaquinone methyltransferase/2-methoxy-6-polyprenyl-1,4-benzoquinol methylase
MTKQTDFGFQQVPIEEKEKKVAEVFHSVANKYDLMNDLMSLGLHRFWKKWAIEIACASSGMKVLDLAGGTGDLTYQFSKQVGINGQVVLADINPSMLEVGKAKLTNLGAINNVKFVEANAEQLPFADNSFDLATIAFGLRNVTDKNKALAELYRVIKPDAKVLILEFSHPKSPVFNKIYDLYSFSVLPFLGKMVADDSDSYQYLAESIRMHPKQEILKQMMIDAGFKNVSYTNLTGGIVALHQGFK